MKLFIQISVLIIAWCGVVNSRHFLREKHIFKTFHFGIVPFPPHHFALSFEKFTPFGTYEFKHEIKKRQIAQPAIPPAINEVLPMPDGPLKVPMTHILEPELKAMEKPAEVLITSVVEPLEPGKQISFLLPVDSEVVITPAAKDVIPEPQPIPLAPAVKPPELAIHRADDIVAITPKPVLVVPPPEVKPIEPKVVLTTPIESTVPPIPIKPVPAPPVSIKPAPVHVKPVPLAPIEPIPPPVVNPIINSVPITPYLYTNIKGIPFFTPAANFVPFLTPAAVPFPEAAIPFIPPPVIKEEVPGIKEVVPVIKQEVPVIKEVVPVIKEEIPVVKEVVPVVPVVKEEPPVVVKEEIPPVVVKEEPPPNIFVKGSRFVLYFGSMMLQMLSRFVNGEINLNQVPPPFLGLQ